MKNDIDFQESAFLWGVTHIAPQVEGDCVTSDWHYASCTGRVPPIGKGDLYIKNYIHHHDLLESLGCNAFRISIEWARIEPEEGVFDEDAITLYRTIFLDLKKRNIQVIVGLFHWSLPMWFATSYGIGHKEARKKFGIFMQKMCDDLGDVIDTVVVLNEPMVYVGTGYLLGERPPFRKNIFVAYAVIRNMIGMHCDTYDYWKVAYPETPVGSTHLWNDIAARGDQHIVARFISSVMARVSEYFRIHFILRRTVDKSDYLGINYYVSNRFFLGKKEGKWGLHTTNDWHSPDVWRHFAKGFSRVLGEAAQYKLPLYVMENGKPSNPGFDDVDRQAFLADHLDVLALYRKSLAIKGYFHHSLMDCYEWDSGYDFKFGLVEVDRDTLELQKRKSFSLYAQRIESDRPESGEISRS